MLSRSRRAEETCSADRGFAALPAPQAMAPRTALSAGSCRREAFSNGHRRGPRQASNDILRSFRTSYIAHRHMRIRRMQLTHYMPSRTGFLGRVRPACSARDRRSRASTVRADCRGAETDVRFRSKHPGSQRWAPPGRAPTPTAPATSPRTKACCVANLRTRPSRHARSDRLRESSSRLQGLAIARDRYGAGTTPR